MEFVDISKESYDKLADEYRTRLPVFTENNKKVIDRYFEHIHKEFGNKPDLTVLDVGVGSGLDLSYFAQKNMTTYGIDVSDEMVKVAKQASPSSTFFVGNFVTHQFDQKFDVIFAQSFIHLFRKHEVPTIFSKFFSLLREGRGFIHFSTTVHDVSEELLLEKEDYVQKVKRFRAHWTMPEMAQLIRTLLEDKQYEIKLLDQYTVDDPLGKHWINNILFVQPRAN
jgi:cyclopropane fatty-acyl-phospholipid synthase-like methyltransferase